MIRTASLVADAQTFYFVVSFFSFFVFVSAKIFNAELFSMTVEGCLSLIAVELLFF